MEDRVTAYLPPGSRRSTQAAMAVLPPGLRDLMAQTRAAVDSALLTSRI